VWTEDSGNPDDLGGLTYLAKSTDNGNTVTHPNIRVNPTPEAVFDDPQVVVAADGSKVYVVYGGAVAGGQADAEDIKATLSLDGGMTWQTPIKVNDDPSCATHWHPAATADASGNLWIIYYDARDGDGRVVWVKAGVASNALAIIDRGLVTDATALFTTSRVSFFLGDYIGLAYGGGKLYATWGDLRDIVATQSVRMYYASGMAR